MGTSKRSQAALAAIGAKEFGKIQKAKKVQKAQGETSHFQELADAIKAAGSFGARGAVASKVQPAFFIIRPSEKDSFFGGYRYSGGIFVPIWFSFSADSEQGKMALFASREEATVEADKFPGAVVIPLNTHP